MTEYTINTQKVENRLFLAFLQLKKITLTDLAKELGLSKATLSYVLHNKNKVVADRTYIKLASYLMGQDSKIPLVNEKKVSLEQ